MSRTRTIKFPNSLEEMENLFDKLQRAVTNRNDASGSLAIHGSASALAKFTGNLYYWVDGVQATKAAADCAALSGTVTNAKVNVFVFTVNAAGTLHSYMGTEAGTFGAVVFPTIPDGEVVYGYVIVNPTGTGNFVGGTTALDDATVAPGAVYVNVTGSFAPFCNSL